jgi:hypothetical protein
MEKLYCVNDTISDKNSGKIRLTVGKVYEKIRTTINGEFIVINDSGVEGKYKPDRFYTAEQHTKLLMGKKSQKSKKIKVNNLYKYINEQRLNIIKLITDTCQNVVWNISDYKTSKYFEKIVQDLLTASLSKVEGVTILPFNYLQYPDIKFKHYNKLYAIDIKTGVYSSAPAFDLAYISTYKESNLKYDGEWVVAISYDPNKNLEDSFVECYFNELHELVNTTKSGLISCGGHQIKIRPINWDKIKKNNFKFKSREQLVKLIDKTLDIRLKNSKDRTIIQKQLNQLEKKGLVDKVFPHIRNHKTDTYKKKSEIEDLKKYLESLDKKTNISKEVLIEKDIRIWTSTSTNFYGITNINYN